MPLSKLDKAIGFSFLEYLSELKPDPDQTEQVAVLTEIISTFFDVNTSNPKDRSTYAVGKSLSSLFATQWEADGNAETAAEEDKAFDDFLKKLISINYFKDTEEGSEEYKQRLDRARVKFQEKIDSKFAGKSSLELKDKGNALMKEGKHAEAVQFYSKAIEIDEKNAVLWCNRAAAYTHLKKFSKAAADARSAILAQPDYVKAHGRLGTALFSMNDYDGAIAAFEVAVELDPANEQYKKDLAAAEGAKKKGSSVTAGGAGPAGMPNLFGGGGGFPGMPNIPGMPDMGSMMNQVMSNPELVSSMMNMMQTPQMQEMMGKMMGSMGMSPGLTGMGMGGPADGEETGDMVTTPFGRLPRGKFEKVRERMFEHPAFKDNEGLKALMSDNDKNPMEVYNEISKHPVRRGRRVLPTATSCRPLFLQCHV